MAESTIMMSIHSFFIGLILFALLFYILGQNYEVSYAWSLLVSTIALVYMVIFGHNLPSTNINENLKFNT